MWNVKTCKKKKWYFLDVLQPPHAMPSHVQFSFYSPNASQGALQYTRPCESLIPLHQYLATGHGSVILRNLSGYYEPLERISTKNFNQKNKEPGDFQLFALLFFSLFQISAICSMFHKIFAACLYIFRSERECWFFFCYFITWQERKLQQLVCWEYGVIVAILLCLIRLFIIWSCCTMKLIVHYNFFFDGHLFLR